MFDPNKITYFGETDFRGARTKFGIKAIDRTRHMYVIGKTGMGKSTILENMAIQDVQNGEGLAFMDPHGGSAEKLMDFIPEDRINDVVYFAPFDTEFPVAFNVLEDVGADKRHLVASGLMSSFKKIWVDAWSARMEYILNNILLALLEYPGATLLGVNRMLSDKEYRKKVVENISDPAVKAFWVDEFAKYSDKYMQEAGAAIQNKIGQFTANPLIRNIIGQTKSSFDIRKIMDEGKILIINLSKGRIGEQNSNLLGGMLITKIYLSAMSRADATPQVLQALPNFYLYVDEFQSFASDSFADILSEARKYKLNLIIAHQYVEQMSEAVRAAVFGNVGSMIVYRVGSFDAQIFEREFLPAFNAEDIVNLGKYQMYLRLMINGVGSKPFSATGIAPIQMTHPSFRKEIIDASRKQFATPRADVEGEVRAWHEEGRQEKKEGFNKNNFQPNSQSRPFEKSFNNMNMHRAENQTSESPKMPFVNNNSLKNKISSNNPRVFKNPNKPNISKDTFQKKPAENAVVLENKFIPKDKPQIQKSVPEKISPSLQKILMALEEKDLNVQIDSPNVPETRPIISPAVIEKKAPTRAVTPESAQLLKNALEKVIASSTPSAPPQKTLEEKDISLPLKTQTPNPLSTQENNSQNQNPSYVFPEPKVEIPEDVLRSVLKTDDEIQS